jgi:hypothetical protein
LAISSFVGIAAAVSAASAATAINFDFIFSISFPAFSAATIALVYRYIRNSPGKGTAKNF